MRRPRPVHELQAGDELLEEEAGLGLGQPELGLCAGWLLAEETEPEVLAVDELHEDDQPRADDHELLEAHDEGVTKQAVVQDLSSTGAPEGVLEAWEGGREGDSEAKGAPPKPEAVDARRSRAQETAGIVPAGRPEEGGHTYSKCGVCQQRAWM